MSFNPAYLENLSQQMYKLNNARENSSPLTKKKITRMKFTPDEDKELLNLVSIYGDQDWSNISAEISKKFNNRTERQCRERYMNYLNPEINMSEWTPEEDQCLLLNIPLNQFHWRQMTQLFPGRSEVQIRNRFNYLHRKHMTYIKPNIANHLVKSFNLYEKNSVIEIIKPSNVTQKVRNKKSEDQINFLNQSYINSIRSSICEIFKNDFNLSNINEICNNTNSIKKNVEVPQQWIEAAKTIINAVHTDEAKKFISDLKEKTDALNRIIECKNLFNGQNKFDNFSDIQSECDPFDVYF